MQKTQPLAICSAVRQAIALAACAFELPALSDSIPEILVQLTPAGPFTPSDGRGLTVPAWRINADLAGRVIAAFKRRKNPAVLDYEHQTINAEHNGQPAPAAGWLRDLVWEEGRGLFARVELTARAQAHIRAGEYRYISPVFRYDPKTGDVLAVEMAALTNHPAIDGMEPLALRAAATFGLTETPMKLLTALIGLSMLSLAADATEDQAVAACSAKLKELEDLRAAMGLPANTDGASAVAACTAMRAQVAAGPDPAKFVPISTVEQLKTDLAALTARTRDREVSELVDQGLADGRLLPAQKDWATKLGKSDLVALSSYLATTPAIAALTSTQTKGKAPDKGAVDDAANLAADELAVCSATGITPEAFAAAKAR